MLCLFLSWLCYWKFYWWTVKKRRRGLIKWSWRKTFKLVLLIRSLWYYKTMELNIMPALSKGQIIHKFLKRWKILELEELYNLIKDMRRDICTMYEHTCMSTLATNEVMKCNFSHCDVIIATCVCVCVYVCFSHGKCALKENLKLITLIRMLTMVALNNNDNLVNIDNIDNT